MANLSETEALEDWHPAMVVAHVRMTGTTLRRLSIAHGLCPDALYQATRKPWRRAEQIIADQLGKTPAEIWPSRYAA